MFVCVHSSLVNSTESFRYLRWCTMHVVLRPTQTTKQSIYQLVTCCFKNLLVRSSVVFETMSFRSASNSRLHSFLPLLIDRQNFHSFDEFPMASNKTNEWTMLQQSYLSKNHFGNRNWCRLHSNSHHFPFSSCIDNFLR